jgi:autotransporter-associated beta strand protein
MSTITSTMSMFQAKAVVLALVATIQSTYAGSATWSSNPTSNDWNTAENWTPPTIPSSETDVATFAVSNTANLMIGVAPFGGGTTTDVGDIVFPGNASSYTITVTPVFDNILPSILEIYGGGIINNSGIVQNFVTANSGTYKASGRIYFNNSSSAGENVVITNQGGAYGEPDGDYGGFTSLEDSSTAGDATFVNNGGEVSGAVGGFTDVVGSSNAESATFINDPGEVSGAGSGWTLVRTLGNIGNSTFIANPATVTDAEGGWVEFDVGRAAGANFIANGATVADAQAGQIYVYGGDGYATLTGKGGSGSGAEGGLIDLFNLPNSDQTIVIAESGANGGLGGHILLETDAVVDLAQFQVFGNGLLDLTNVTISTMPIGSLAGNGVVLLAGHGLSAGNNNLSTTFSGVIQDAGSVIKVGTGTLTLSGASTYTSGTSVTAGTLRAKNQSDSATGTGPVKVTAGTLGGSGIIAGKVTIGDGSGTSAFLQPSVGVNSVAQLTLQRALTFKADGTYIYKLSTRNARADQVTANGVTIESGAQFNFQAVANRRLAIGTVFTAISNTSASPIAGTFANLPDGSIFTVGRNNYQVSYQGGDGNDLTLTVVP